MANTLLINSDCEAHFRRIAQTAGGPAAVVKTNTTGTARVYADIIELTSGTTCIINFGVTATNAVLIIRVRTLMVNAVGGYGVGDASNEGHIHIEAEDIYLMANNTIGILRSAATADTTVGRVGHILEIGSPTGTIGVSVTGGEVDIIADLIDADTALSTGASGTINGFVADVQGTIVKTGDLRVVIGRAAPISGVGSPSGSVTGFYGQIYENTSTGEWWVCDSDPSGTSWTQLTTASGLASNSFPGIQQSIFVDLGTVTGSEDGTVQNPYHTINAAITAANGLTPSTSNRIEIFVYPGVYVEAVVTQDDFVAIRAFEAGATIVRQSGASPPLTLAHRNMAFTGLTFDCAAGSTANIVSVTGVSTDDVTFRQCSFLGTAGDASNYFNETRAGLEFYECKFQQGDDTERIFYFTISTARTCKFFDCDLAGVVDSQGDATIEAHDCTFDSSASTVGPSFRGTLRFNDLTPKHSFYGCFIKNSDALGYPVWSNALMTDCADFFGCEFESASPHDMSGQNTATIGVYGCKMSKGMDSNIRTRMDVKYANGAAGDQDYYTDIDEAMNSLAAGDDGCTIYLLGDYSANVQVQGSTLGIYVTIDGQGHEWEDTNIGSGFTFLAQSGVNVLRNINFVTSNVAGQGTGTKLIIDDCDITGVVTQLGVGDDASTQTVIHDSSVVGVTGALSALSINDADPTIIVSQSYLKGAAGNPAVDYNTIDNDNLQCEFSTLMHGDLGINDNPFGGAAATQIDYAAHHCTFNAEPDIEDPADFNNLIDLGQRYNTIDADGDYAWRKYV